MANGVVAGSVGRRWLYGTGLQVGGEPGNQAEGTEQCLF